MSAGLAAGVVRFYDTHPINEDEILARLAARGTRLEALTEDELKDFDQDHYGGVQVVDALADKAGIRRGLHVLDVCSGMGGPARWLAHTRGCRVTGLDFTRSRVEAARRLTARTRLEGLVDFVEGDATAMPLADGAYDVVISQEAWLHVPDKPAVVRECARVAKPGGTLAFTDVVVRGALAADDEARLAAGMHAHRLCTAARYREVLEASGLRVASHDDLGDEWAAILRARLEMYRSMRDTTVAKFGEARYLEYDRVYSHFVGLFGAGVLGGARFVAHRPPA